MVVVSAAILVFRPGSGLVTASSDTSINSRSVSANLSDLDSYRGLQNPDSASPKQENYIDVSSNSTVIADNSGDAAKKVISVPKPSAAAVPDVKPAAQAKPKSEPPKPAAAPAAPKKAYRDYWVQAGSYSTRERADGVKNTLGTKGIAAIITNQEINGNLYYRVRIGPYTTQNEADYWLAMVKSIDGFQDSLIWESTSIR